MTPETEIAAMARTYANCGLSVFPLFWVVDGGRCVCPAGAGCGSPGKHPLVRQGVHEASAEPAQVAAWWQRWPRANVGLPAGANGLAVLDVDPRHGGHESLSRLLGVLLARGLTLPATLTQATGGGGLHLVYAAPDGGIKGGSNVFGPSMTGLDSRGRGGYIVVAPSVHSSGATYRWIDFLADIAPWPAALSVLMEPAKPAPSQVAGTAVPINGGGYAFAALRGEVERVRQAPEGSRNHALNRASFSLGQLVAAGLLDADEAGEALMDAAADAGLAPAESRATVRSGLRGGARAPRAVPA